MSNRFQLEQGILRCWNIIEDIQELIEADKYDLIQSTLEFYNFKFDKMFETFEDCIKSEFSHRTEIQELKKEIDRLKSPDWPNTPHYTGGHTTGQENVNPDYPFPF
jgi:hypothetical protein